MQPMPPEGALPRKNSNWILYLVIALVAVCIITIIAGFFTCRGVINAGRSTVSCMIAAEITATSIKAYAQENDGRLPNASTWQDDIRPYYENLYNRSSEQFADAPQWVSGFFELSAPGEPIICHPDSGEETGLFFNTDISGLVLAEIQDQRNTALIFEVPGPTYNGHEPFVERPFNQSPIVMRSHRGWVNIYVDGRNSIGETQPGATSGFTVDDALGR